MAKWKVNVGRQVNVDGTVYEGGATFEASDDQVAPLAAWVTKVKAAPATDTKAQTSSPNKAQTSSPNKSK